jgi:drug/metabolite transporter (DMT)-like permease
VKISNTAKGYLLSFISVIAVSNVYIFSKAALLEVNILQFGTYWFGFALLWILLYTWYRKSFHILRKINQKQYLILVVAGLLDVLATYFFFKAIDTISNPSIVSFIGNLAPAFIITLSFLILKERFNKLELLGILMALAGAFIISYKGSGKINEMFLEGAQYVLYSSIVGAFNAVIIKKNIKKISPVIFSLNRTIFLLIFSVMAFSFSKYSLSIPTSALTNIIIGSILGPFLTVISGYLAIQYVPLSIKAIIGSTRGLFVLFGAYFYFGNFPKPIAILGGIITIIGVLLIAVGQIRMRKKSAN